MEKLKMIKGSLDRADEVRKILKSWGAKDVKLYVFTDENYYFFVINDKTQLILKDDPLLNYIEHEVVELSEPEESEDEKLRKQLLNWFKGCKWESIDNETLKRDDIIAWLEKQGEFQYWKPSEEQLEALDYAYNLCPDTERGNYYESVLRTLIYDLHKLSEKQGEQDNYNPYKATVEAIVDMVEKYAPFDANLQDFYNNVKIKCKDAMEYDNTWLEKQGQVKETTISQHETESCEKNDDFLTGAKPKFRVGDWITIKE